MHIDKEYLSLKARGLVVWWVTYSPPTSEVSDQNSESDPMWES